MIVYRIAKAEFANQMVSSGRANRWNKNFEQVIYTSGSISLCALELLAHTGGIRPAGTYQIMHIEIEDKSSITKVNPDLLPEDWQMLGSYPLTQEIGSTWYKSLSSVVLEIPSAIIQQEHNFILNCQHPDFSREIKLVELSDFIWDHRFPEMDLIS